MYVLGPRDQISIPVRFDSVETVPNEYHGKPELSIKATLRLSPNADRDIHVILWADVKDAEQFAVSEEFIARDISIDTDCDGDHANPYARAHAGLHAIWGDASKGESKTLALVRYEEWELPRG